MTQRHGVDTRPPNCPPIRHTGSEKSSIGHVRDWWVGFGSAAHRSWYLSVRARFGASAVLSQDKKDNTPGVATCPSISGNTKRNIKLMSTQWLNVPSLNSRMSSKTNPVPELGSQDRFAGSRLGLGVAGINFGSCYRKRNQPLTE